MTAASKSVLKAVLKWWVVIAFAIALTLAGIERYTSDYGALNTRITKVETRMDTHEKSQDETLKQVNDNMKYIRDRLDKVLDERRKQ